MKIDKVQIKHFKSLKEFQIAGFKQLNLIFGINNSGKSNFLKFLEIIFSRKKVYTTSRYSEDGTEKVERRFESYMPFWEGTIYDMPYLFWNNEKNKNIEFDIRFSLHLEELISIAEWENIFNDKESKSKEVFIDFKGIIFSKSLHDSEIQLMEANINDHIFYLRENDVINYFSDDKFKSNLRSDRQFAEEILAYFNDSVLLIDNDRYFDKELISENANELSSKVMKNWLFEQNLNSDKYHHFTGFINLIREINFSKKVEESFQESLSSFPFNNPEITFATFGEELEIMLTNKNFRLPLKNYGNGIHQLFFLLLSIYNTNSKIILIEELELNLSLQYQTLILDVLRSFIEKGNFDQLFYTSHGEYLFRKDIPAFQISINKDGCTSIEKSSYDQIKDMKNAQLDL